MVFVSFLLFYIIKSNQIIDNVYMVGLTRPDLFVLFLLDDVGKLRQR